jgi:hypothetical protein
MERHGREPVLARFNGNDEELEAIKEMITTFKSAGTGTWDHL